MVLWSRSENIQIKSQFLPHVHGRSHVAHVKIPCATEMINQNAELGKCTFFDHFSSVSRRRRRIQFGDRRQ